MDPCLSKILEGRQKLPKDKELEIIQAKVRDVMGPLGRSWSVIEEVKKAMKPKKFLSKTFFTLLKRRYICWVKQIVKLSTTDD